MNIINGFTVSTASTAIALAIGSQSALSLNTQPQPTDHESQTSTVGFLYESSPVSGDRNFLQVQDSEISMPIPQPLTMAFFLTMAGLGGFFKLKIVHTKLKHHSEDS